MIKQIYASSVLGAKILIAVGQNHVAESGEQLNKVMWGITANMPLGIIQMAEGAIMVASVGQVIPGWSFRFISWRMTLDEVAQQREAKAKRDRGCTG